MERIKTFIQNKKVLILGYGAEGKSTFDMLIKIGGYFNITVADFSSKQEILDLEKNFDNVFVKLGENYLENLANYDIIFRSPGINISDYEIGNAQITSQTEIFLELFSEQVIGVTGTKGKSTVSSLLYHIIKEEKHCILCGNVGIPPFDVIKDIQKETLIVMELSCHQLSDIKKSPYIAILLNIFEDHLDYYKTFENYSKTKHNIYKYQNSEDLLFVNKNIDLEKTKCIVNKIDPLIQEKKYENLTLRGQHNIYNCDIVYHVCEFLGIKSFDNSLKTFKPLAHRLEFVKNVQNVDYYNDSISTTVESTICAIESIDNISTILIGGMDRGIDYTKLVSFLEQTKKLQHVILMYESGKRIKNEFKNIPSANVHIVEDLNKAMDLAQKVAQKSTAVVLSPGAASYGYFKNFQHRGECFKELVYNLEK